MEDNDTRNIYCWYVWNAGFLIKHQLNTSEEQILNHGN